MMDSQQHETTIELQDIDNNTDLFDEAGKPSSPSSSPTPTPFTPSPSLPEQDGLSMNRYMLTLMFASCSLIVTLLVVWWSIVYASPSGCNQFEGCPLCTAMGDVINKHAQDLNEVGDSPESINVFVQATVMHSLWIVPVGNYVNEAKAIVGFSFAQGEVIDGTPSPGGTNYALAWSIVQLLAEYEAAGRDRPQVMVQWEIAQVLWEEYGIVADVNASIDAEGNYLSTYGVMEQLVAPLQEAKIDTITLVAHPDHAVRCGKVVQNFNVTAVGTQLLRADGGIPWSTFGCDEYGYDKLSTQPWTTERVKYLMHELRARPDMVSQGQISFSNDHFRAV
eukprot:CAMPEP_0201520714 /NCGR_PEP_ID=MMETSP0161_2-20130828/12207_1 /ASSEMBLY_ACC=CAM_ASM_000251 /TAXON_ID=180227 /ORGANISM="Neoparamoeba aestuarina, Strain SoJaBio B1-5/56/2" /LENGTH=334 /DNA_ID=CAMNT_0047919183 /DNA_START=261 /DNA_END=1265 /DNA_ORIENTATION=-